MSEFKPRVVRSFFLPLFSGMRGKGLLRSSFAGFCIALVRRGKDQGEQLLSMGSGLCGWIDIRGGGRWYAGAIPRRATRGVTLPSKGLRARPVGTQLKNDPRDCIANEGHWFTQATHSLSPRYFQLRGTITGEQSAESQLGAVCTL